MNAFVHATGCATGGRHRGPPISHVKRSFGLRRTRLRRMGDARIWVGLGIFVYNLQPMT